MNNYIQHCKSVDYEQLPEVSGAVVPTVSIDVRIQSALTLHTHALKLETCTTCAEKGTHACSSDRPRSSDPNTSVYNFRDQSIGHV